MSNKSTVGILIALIALLGVFYYVTNLGVPKQRVITPPKRISSAEMWQKVVDSACRPVRGNPKARWTVIEIGDFQCPICGRSRKYVETMIDKSQGLANLYFLNFPLQMHEFGVPAAAAGLAAEKQGKFWAMYDQMYSHQDNLNPRGLIADAQAIGMNIKEFRGDIRSSAIYKRLDSQRMVANQLSIAATPTFLVHEEGASTFKIFIGMWPQADFGNAPGLRQLMLDTPWGVKLATADIPPAKSTDK